MNPLDATIAQLVERLASSDGAERTAAAEALCRAGAAAAPAAAELVKACADGDDAVREWSVAALEDLGTPPEESIVPLLTLAASADALVAYWAITLLGRCGTLAAPAVAIISARLAADSPAEVRQRSAWALGKIGAVAVEARPALEAAATSADPRLARLATEAIAAIGS